MFFKQINNYKTRLYKTKDSVASLVIKDDGMEEGLKGNTQEFKNECLSIAKRMSPGRISAASYAGVVAYFCEKYGVAYKVYAGFCLPFDYPKRDREIESYNKGLAEGKEHPCIATHIYIVAGEGDNKITYEYYNGKFDSDKIDVVEVE